MASPIQQLVDAANILLGMSRDRGMMRSISVDLEADIRMAIAAVEFGEVETRWEVQRMFQNGGDWCRWFQAFVEGEAQSTLSRRKKSKSYSYYDSRIICITTIRIVESDQK